MNILRFIEGRIVSQSEDRFTNGCENLIVIVVPYIERQIAIDTLERTGPDQTTRATRANAFFDCLFRQMFDYVSRATSGDLSFDVPARFPQTSHMSQPQMRGFNVH